MNEGRRVYLDNAATSFPKPDVVYEAVDHYQRQLGGAVGRGATQVGREIQQRVDRCRNLAARLFGVKNSSHVIFCSNGTDALNLGLHGILKPHDHVIATCWEHNSILRPLAELKRTDQVHTTFIEGTPSGGIDLDALKRSLQQKTRLVCLTHASNVTGVVQPIADVVELAHQAGALVLLDAAQTVGHLPISMLDLNVDLLACPGHKGLLGPLGTGLLAIRPGLEAEIDSIRQGGTGTVSESETQPSTLPEKYESGNHNAPGIIGLEAALNWLDRERISKVQQHEQELAQLFIRGLRKLSPLETYATEEEQTRVGVVSLNANQLEPQVLASVLDEHFRIETRAGLHCSPRAHAALGTKSRGGTVRFSFGPFNTIDDVDFTLEALAQITAAF